jgi:hypothetical protein
LDWSISPKVALHFATCEEKHFDADGAVWCVDTVRALELLPPNLRQILDESHAFIFSVEMLENVTSLKEFDALSPKKDFVLFLEPPSLDARIINQGAVMSAMPGPMLNIEVLLKKNPQLYRRIIIPKKLKWEIRDKLDQDNVTERMLFPGLDGLSQWLRRYYGAGPTGKRKIRDTCQPGKVPDPNPK